MASECVKGLSGGGIPDMGGVVPRDGDDARAVGAEGRARHAVLVAKNRAQSRCVKSGIERQLCARRPGVGLDRGQCEQNPELRILFVIIENSIGELLGLPFADRLLMNV